MKPRYCSVTVRVPMRRHPVAVQSFRSVKKARAYIAQVMRDTKYTCELFCEYEQPD